MAEEAIDRMKTEAGDVPLIAVGGGAFLIPDKLPGVSQVIHVEHGDCANAVGAAIAQVSGECDQIFKDMTPRRGALPPRRASPTTAPWRRAPRAPRWPPSSGRCRRKLRRANGGNDGGDGERREACSAAWP